MELWLEDGGDSRLEVYQNNRWVGATVSLMMTMIKLFSAGYVLGLRAAIGKNTDHQKILRVSISACAPKEKRGLCPCQVLPGSGTRTHISSLSILTE